MHIPGQKLFASWCVARRFVFLYIALVFGFFFAVYALYGYPWDVAGYAALLGLAAGLVFAIADFTRYRATATALAQMCGRFPTAPLPTAQNMPQQLYSGIVAALEEERKRLEQQNESQKHDADEYYTLWAHQIKTPIAAMRLLLQSGGGKADIEQELFRIEQYVEMVLQYQRLSSLQNDLVLQRYPLDTLVKQAAKNCASLFIYKHIPFQVRQVQGSIVTDKKWFVFVLEQLYTNALKYTAAGSISVYTQGDCLVVEDTGIGIAPQDLPRVFQRGFTGVAGRSERSSTGIGLYLCREVMRTLGFGITIQSTPGQGTRVLLQLAQHSIEAD